ncbi:MAG: helix-turn-helix transcriptional regulator [Silanimonas sp.]
MTLNDEMLGTIDHFYGAAADPEHWPLAMVSLADLMGAEDAALGVASPNGIPWLVAPRTDPSYLASYADYRDDDLVWQRIVERGEGQVATDQMVARRDELTGSAYYNEWCVPQSYAHKLGSLVLEREGWLTVLVLPGSRPFEHEHVDRLSTLLPHLRNAVRIGSAMGETRATDSGLEALVARASGGALVVAADGTVPIANDRARQWLKRGLRMNGSVCRKRLVVDGELARNVARCERRDPNDPPTDVELMPGIVVQVLPLRHTASPCHPGTPVALVVEAPKTRETQGNVLCTRHGLTPAEARVALDMRAGDGRRRTAERLGISDTTVRCHLTRIFEKLEVNRQAQLIGRLAELLD